VFAQADRPSNGEFPEKMSQELKTNSILAPDEPPAYEIAPGDSVSPYVVICDHASRRLPRALGTLGVTEVDLASHIAWDIGILGVAGRLVQALNAFFIFQNYSRLVIDCNRPLSAPDSIAQKSAGVDVPGNRDLSSDARELRQTSVFWPYHDQIQAELDRRERALLPTILVLMHSFTPVFMGNARPWHVGVLYNRDSRIAAPLLELLRSDASLVVGDNQPYAVSDTSDYSIVVHGERRGLPHVEIEIRQDLICEAELQAAWAVRLEKLLLGAAESLR
jgi:predicted N-formylglutamate amidohydrolase